MVAKLAKHRQDEVVHIGEEKKVDALETIEETIPWWGAVQWANRWIFIGNTEVTNGKFG